MRRGIARSLDATQGVIWKQMLLFFVPIMLGSLLQLLYNTVDTIVVGRFVGKEALAAVGGSAAILIGLLVNFFVGLASGASVIISQQHGARDHAGVKKSVHTAIALALAGGGILMVVGITLAEPLLRLMKTPEDTLEGAITYMRIYFSGIIPTMLYNMGAGILRAVGDSRRPLYFLGACCCLNIVLDLLFVLVFKMGVAGVALATILSTALSAVLVILSLIQAQYSYKLYPREIRLHKDVLLRILRIGLPAGIQSSFYSIANMLVQSSINSFGTDAVAAWSTFSKIDAVFWLIIGAFGITTTTFVGQNFGAGKMDRVRSTVRAGLVMSLILSIAVSLFLSFGGRFLYSIFTHDEGVIEVGLRMMSTITPFYFTFICIEILSGCMRGVGQALKPMLITCFGVCVLRISWVLIALPLMPRIETVAMSFPITWAVTSILFVIYYLKGNWMPKPMPQEVA